MHGRTIFGVLVVAVVVIGAAIDAKHGDGFQRSVARWPFKRRKRNGLDLSNASAGSQ
jgi:hypothetical protein